MPMYSPLYNFLQLMTNMQVDHPLPNTSNSASGASGASSEVDVSFDHCYAVLNMCFCNVNAL